MYTGKHLLTLIGMMFLLFSVIVAGSVMISYFAPKAQASESKAATRLTTPIKNFIEPYLEAIEPQEDVLEQLFILSQKKTGVQIAWGEFETITDVATMTGVSWQVLMAKYKCESTCGRDQNQYGYNPYEVLAGQPDQLAALKRICRKIGVDPRKVRSAKYGEIGPFQILPDTFEANATDGDGDGLADPWSLADSATTAAVYLKTLGYDQNRRLAVVRYNAGPMGDYSPAGQHHAQKVFSVAKALGL